MRHELTLEFDNQLLLGIKLGVHGIDLGLQSFHPSRRYLRRRH